MSNYRSYAGAAAAAALGLSLSPVVQALEQGDWFGRIGVTHVAPNDSSGTVVTPGGPVPGTGLTVDSDTNLGFTVGYMVTAHIGVELLAALPFEHDIGPNTALAGVTGSPAIGSTKHLPPTLSAQYYFRPKSSVRPYVGVGVNYTRFFDEEVRGGLASAGYGSLELDDSWGMAGQVGIDVDVAQNWFVNFDVRYLDIDTEATVRERSAGSGALGAVLTIDDIEIDPWVYTISIGTTF